MTRRVKWLAIGVAVIALGVAGCGGEDAAEAPTQPPTSTSAAVDPIQRAQDALQSREERAAEARAEARRQAQEAAAAERKAEAQRRRSREAARRSEARRAAEQRRAQAGARAKQAFYAALDGDAVALESLLDEVRAGAASADDIWALRLRALGRSSDYAIKTGFTSQAVNELSGAAADAAVAAENGDPDGLADAQAAIPAVRRALSREAAG